MTNVAGNPVFPSDCVNCTDLDLDLDCSQCYYSDFYPNATWLSNDFVTSGEMAWKIVLFISVTTVSLVGNSLILWVLWILPDARNSTNILIGNMALGHLPTVVIYCSVGIYKFISAHNFLAGAFMCEYELSLKFCCLTATNLSLITMAVDRLRSFYWPGSMKLSRGWTLIICGLIWLCSIVFGYVFSIVRKLKHINWHDYDEYVCMDANNDSKAKYGFGLLGLGFLVYFPIITMVILYSLIVKKLWQFEATMFSNMGRESRGPSTSREYSRPVIQMIWLYLIVTIICYIPFQFLLIRRELVYPTFNENYADWEIRWDFCRHLFFCIYTAVNPFIFGFANMTFRNTVKEKFLRSSGSPVVPLVQPVL